MQDLRGRSMVWTALVAKVRPWARGLAASMGRR